MWKTSSEFIEIVSEDDIVAICLFIDYTHGTIDVVEHDRDQGLDMRSVVHACICHGFAESAVDLYEKYSDLYSNQDENFEGLPKVMKEYMAIGGVRRIGMSHVHVYEAIRDRDAVTINRYLLDDETGRVEGILRSSSENIVYEMEALMDSDLNPWVPYPYTGVTTTEERIKLV
ncbi:hypothetical protein DFQ28_002581 [Apophysomyces sp. BC1034]|nr:hypothetical protein DFQ29_007175 [Apophysomyces sp. BC1021]KAG0193933.1 hypothetical protein DFQ28_002581 [Apophysomyces sp. BC1034]